MSTQYENPDDLTNYMCSPVYKKSGYALSSWNYGSFHPCNPYYQNQERSPETHVNHERSQSAGLNQYGKRKLQEEEKIVTEDLLQMMKDFKAIKSGSNTKMKRNKSSAQIRINQQQEISGENSQMMGNNLSVHSHSQSQIRNSIKPFKYQLSFEEWAAVKAKQMEISKKVKIIKESEDQNFEFFNKKINENYKIIQEQNFNEWLQKKQSEKIKKKSKISKQEEMKEIGKIRKQEESSMKMEMWFKRQAELLDSEAKNKKFKSEKQKEEKMLKSKEEQIKKAKAEEAFRFWLKKKEEEKKLLNTNKANMQGTYGSQGTQGSNKLSNYGTHTSGSNSTKAFSRKQKIPIGPYSNAKDLRKIQKRLLSSSSAGSNYMYNQDMNEQNAMENQSDYEEDKQEMYSKENIEDSLQELSSIKKDTPAQDQEPDYD